MGAPPRRVEQRLRGTAQCRAAGQQALLAVADVGRVDQGPAMAESVWGVGVKEGEVAGWEGVQGDEEDGAGSDDLTTLAARAALAAGALLERLGQAVPAAHAADAQHLVVVQRQRDGLLLQVAALLADLLCGGGSGERPDAARQPAAPPAAADRQLLAQAGTRCRLQLGCGGPGVAPSRKLLLLPNEHHGGNHATGVRWAVRSLWRIAL